MGYAQLAEGKVEKLKWNRNWIVLLRKSFGPGAWPEAQVERDYSLHLPPLLMQRSHFSEIIVNLLQNAREATKWQGPDLRDGPDRAGQLGYAQRSRQRAGFPRSILRKSSNPISRTKEKGDRPGLAIVRNNAECTGARCKCNPELGKGTLVSDYNCQPEHL